ncbi:spore wall synthesis complex protein [soil metagenome]
MPLSEHEQRLLEQIERALIDDDPKFASTVRSTDLRTRAKRKVRLSAVLFVLGLALLIGGAVTQTVALGVFGFLVMFAGGGYAVIDYKHLSGVGDIRGADKTTASAPARKQRKVPLKSRLEERFRRRYDE